MKCPNHRITDPVYAKVISCDPRYPDEVKYIGKTGWVSREPNKYGVVAFCAKEGKYPFQWNADMKNFELISSLD